MEWAFASVQYRVFAPLATLCVVSANIELFHCLPDRYAYDIENDYLKINNFGWEEQSLAQVMIDKDQLELLRKFDQANLHKKKDLLRFSVKKKNIAAVRYLCDMDILVKQEMTATYGEDADTLLHEAIRDSNLEIFELLLTTELKNLIKKKNSKGVAPLKLAVERHRDQKAWSVVIRRVINQMTLARIAETPARQSPTGLFGSLPFYRDESMSVLEEEPKQALRELLAREVKAVENVSAAEPVTFVQQPPIVVYSSHNPAPAIKEKKTVKVDAEPIHAHLHGIHDTIVRENKTKAIAGNIVIAAMTFIFDNPEHTERKHYTLMLDCQDESVVCEEDSDAFLSSVSCGLMVAGAASKAEDFLRHIHLKDEIHKVEPSYDEEPGFSRGHGFHFKYIHSEQALIYFLSKEETVRQMLVALKTQGVLPKSKLCAVVLDIHSTKPLCANICREALLGLQNGKMNRASFMYWIYKIFPEEFHLPVRKNQIKMITRFSSANRLSSEDASKVVDKLEFELNERTQNTVIVSSVFNKEPANPAITLQDQPFTLFLSTSKKSLAPKMPDEYQEKRGKKRAREEDATSTDTPESPAKLARL